LHSIGKNPLEKKIIAFSFFDGDEISLSVGKNCPNFKKHVIAKKMGADQV
jgi:hypothetical protein